MKKYAIYLRRSRADLEAEALGKGETLARHLRSLTELADRSGYEIGEIYREIRSGESIDARPEMLRLLSDVENRRWAGVLCMDIDRLARGDSSDQGRITRTFSLSGTLIVTPGKVYDMSDDDDEEYADFGLFLARKEYKSTRRRMMRGRRASAEEGHFLGSVAPYGYDKVKQAGGRGYTLAPNCGSETVRLIFSLCAAGSGSTAIAAQLDRLGVPSRGGGKWSRASISDILHNPVYCGKIRWQYRREKKRISGGKVTSHREISDDYILVDGLHPAIISESEFERVQQMLADRRHSSAKASAELRNPLAGLVFCGKCGALMQRICGRNEARLACPDRGCDNVSSRLSVVEDALVSALSEWTEMRVGEKRQRAECRGVPRTAGILRARLERLSEQAGAVYSYFEQGIYSAEEFRARLKALDEQRRRTAELLDAADTELSAEKAPSVGREFRRTETVAEIYRRASAAERNRLLRALVVRAEYTKERRCAKNCGGSMDFSLKITAGFPASGCADAAQ